MTRFGLAVVVLAMGGGVLAADPTQTGTKETTGQQVCVPETDPRSPRKSRLEGNDTSSTQVLREDLDKDGDPDIIETWLNGKRVRWFDENDNALPTDSMGDLADDMCQIDRDGDGYYDGPDDITVKWVDSDGDGDGDLEAIAINPNRSQKTLHASSSHYMIFEDVDDDNVHGCLDWRNFEFSCWRTLGSADFMPDYNGDSIFLKVHDPAFAIEDPRYNWENPFAFYDFDKDGVTEMAIRFCDNPEPVKNAPKDKEWMRTFDGKLEESFVAWDLDNDSQKNNEMDFDMSIRMADGKKLDYSRFRNSWPKLKAADWVIKYMRYPNWRKIDELVYVPHDKCYDEIFEANWGKAYFVFDEDDDDHRWERVEIYYPPLNETTTTQEELKDNVYRMARWKKGQTGGGLMGHPQSDMLGDRGEYDMDFSGRGRVYVGKWDRKIHLYGAEWGAWLVDYNVKYWGSWPVVGDSSPAKPAKVEEVVHYADTDRNGFIDQVEFDYDGDKKMELAVSLKDLGINDEAEIIDPAAEKWQGMHELFTNIAEDNWEDALIVYWAAWHKNLLTNEITDLAVASSTADRYINGYWLKERILRLLLERLTENDAGRREVLKAYFAGDGRALAKFISSRDWAVQSKIGAQ